MSTAIETTVTNNATVDVAPVATNATKKSFPAKYLKVLSIGLYVLKKMHPDVYVDKFVEHMKIGDSIESIMSEIDEHVFAAATHLENEVRQIKRDLGKKPKKAKKSRVAKSAETKDTKVETKGTTEHIVELANEPTIVRGGDEPIIPQEPKKTKKSKKAAAPVITETVTAPVVVETPAPVVTETATAPVVVDTPAPKAKVTKAKVPKVPKDVAAAEPVKVKEELDVGEPKVAVEVAKESKKATKKAPKKAAAPVPSECTPSDELVEESEKE